MIWLIIGIVVLVIVILIVLFWILRKNNNTFSISSRSNANKESWLALWFDHIYLTREFILAEKCGDQNQILSAQNALLSNQDDLGRRYAVKYGEEKGKQFTELLKEHIVIAKAIVEDLKVSQDPTNNINQWYRNAEDISKFLVSNNRNLNYDAVYNMWKEHLDLTSAEAINIINGNFEASVNDFEAVRQNAIKMAKMFETI